MKAIRNIEGAPKPVGAYSPAVVQGDLVFVSGQIGLDPINGMLVGGGIEHQAKQVLLNLNTILKAAGSSPEKILMTSIFLADIADAKIVNELYSGFVNPENPPARQTMAVRSLPLGALVEISLIAATY